MAVLLSVAIDPIIRAAVIEKAVMMHIAFTSDLSIVLKVYHIFEGLLSGFNNFCATKKTLQSPAGSMDY